MPIIRFELKHSKISTMVDAERLIGDLDREYGIEPISYGIVSTSDSSTTNFVVIDFDEDDIDKGDICNYLSKHGSVSLVVEMVAPVPEPSPPSSPPPMKHARTILA